MTFRQLTRFLPLALLSVVATSLPAAWTNYRFADTSELSGQPRLPVGMVNPSMVQDSQGNLYTAFFLEVESDPLNPSISQRLHTLYWVKWSKNEWKEVRVTLAQETITQPQVAVDSQGNAYVFYLHNGTIEYSLWSETQQTFDPTRTNIQTDNFVAGVYYDSALQETRPHITYLTSQGHVMHDFQNGNASQVVANSSTYSSINMSLDNLGNPHIFYHDVGGDEGLYYAQWNGAAFQRSRLAGSNKAGQFSDSVFDTQGNLHLCYYDLNRLELRYTVKSVTSGAWLPAETADNNWENGGLNSISVDTSGRVHISYVGFYGFQFKYATNRGGVWRTETIEGSTRANFFKGTAIQVDVAGFVHILTFTNEKDYIQYWSDTEAKVPLVDNDLDGVSDFEERELETDPFLPDTDFDGLLDGEERELGTDPHNIDTDRDGITDAKEEKLLLDPLTFNTNLEISIALAIKHNLGNTDPFGVKTPYTSGWVYTLDMGWVYTDPGLYPWIYVQNENKWLYYQNGTANPRWFWNANTGIWERR
jgi:hypothetical protein